jgi:RNA polymerase sigma-70 factor (ECF subfamily)
MTSFHAVVGALFQAHFHRLYRYLDRLSGDPALAADLAQDAFVRLYQRGSAPDSPEAWLITVGTNLLRNERSKGSRRARLMTPARAEAAHSDPAASPADAAERAELSRRVREALDGLPARERRLLLLRAEGYRYRDIALALELNEASVGTLLARAKRAFRVRYESRPDAS